jgi:threonine synthase
MASFEGIFAAPEGGAALVAVEKLSRRGKIKPGEAIVVFNTGSGYKYLEVWRSGEPNRLGNPEDTKNKIK